VVVAAHVIDVRQDRDYGITTVVAGLLTFALGALTMLGSVEIAAAATVVMTTLLGMKPQLHDWVARLEAKELFATLKLLLISVVLLPLLPNRGFGPGESLNPYVIWWLVVLIAGISFVGYFAIKIAGARIGILLTGIFGGLASSTALTLHFSRLGRDSPAVHRLLAAGVIVAATTMFPRVLLEVSVINRALLGQLLWPLMTMTVIGYAVVALVWFGERRRSEHHTVTLKNPFEIGTALKFAALLVGVTLVAKLANTWFGDVGVYVTAAISGISDVDAITLSLARLARDEMSAEVAARGIIIASVVNTAVKAGLVVFLCGGRMGREVTLALSAALLGGLAVLLVAV
jgi:uncharacterized membrane protein (DUF4010 family)